MIASQAQDPVYSNSLPIRCRWRLFRCQKVRSTLSKISIGRCEPRSELIRLPPGAGPAQGASSQASTGRPATRRTGVYFVSFELIPKRLELLREILPQPGLIAFLVGPQGLQ